MKTHIFLFILILGFSSITLFAQDDYISIGLGDLVGQLNLNNTIQPPSSEIEGSPYLNSEFQVGEVYYNKKYQISHLPMRYNLYNGDLEYNSNNAIMAFANPELIDKVIIGNDVFIFIERGRQSNLVSGFVKMWNDQFPTIISKLKIEYLKKEPAKAFEESKPARFKKKNDIHYLMKSPEDIEKIKSVKKLIQSLQNHQGELTSFSKREKISSNKPEEMARLLNFYHGLE